MNGPQTPAYVKDNSFTRLINRVSQMNAEEGKPAGRSMSQAAEMFQPAIPAHKLRGLTAAQQARLDFVPPSLSPEEAHMANARAQAMGLDDVDSLPVIPGRILSGPNTPVHPGDPSDEEIEAMLPSRFRTDSAPDPGHVAAVAAHVPSGRPMNSDDARGMIGARAMPNFRNIQGFNLERGVAVVDGIEFPLADEDVRDMKKFALHVVLDSMVIQVAQALVDIGVPEEMAKAAAQSLKDAAAHAAVPGSMKDGGKPAGNETVLEVPTGTAAGEVREESSEAGRPPVGVPDMLEVADGGEDTFWLLEDSGESGDEPAVSDDGGGSGGGTP
jgi:hypothetical protein